MRSIQYSGTWKGGLWTTLDNRVRFLQSKGMTRKPHNILSEKDVRTLFTSPELDGRTPRSFQCRLMYGVAMLTAMRTKELSSLKVSQFRKTEIEGVRAYIVKGVMGGVGGNCKNSKGGLRQINETPKEVPIFDFDELDGILNVYKDVEKYLSVRENMDVPPKCEDRFFLGINGQASRFEDFFRRSPVSVHQVRRVIQKAAEANGIVGLGDHDHIVFHCICKTTTQRCVDGGFADSAITKRTGHRCIESLRSYEHLKGVTGMKQQSAILKSADSAQDHVQKRMRVAGEGGGDDISRGTPGPVSVQVHANGADGHSMQKHISGALQTIGAIHGATININIHVDK